MSWHKHRHLAVQPNGILAATQAKEGIQVSYLHGALPNLPFRDNGRQVCLADTGDLKTEPAEPELFAGRCVLLGIRALERSSAVVDWLHWHAHLGFDAALIIDQNTSDDALPSDLPMDVLTLTSDATLSIGVSPGMGPLLSAPIAIEAVRHRYLSLAKVVMIASVSDLLLSENLLDAVQRSNSGYIATKGRTAYPWRLRRGAPAPLHDHIYVRDLGVAELSGWIVAPDKLPKHAQWWPFRIDGVESEATADASFVRAMCTAQPGEDPKALVDRFELIEDDALARRVGSVFITSPLRRKKAPPAKNSSDDLTIVTAMKNEGPFILDWLAHHRVVGAERFLIYTNDCEDGTDELLNALANAGIVSHKANPFRATGQVPQRAAFDAARTEPEVADAGWLMTLDVDEYLNIHIGNGTLDDLHAAFPEANVISIPWRLFGSGDKIAFEDRPVTEQFHDCAPAFCPKPHQAWGFKTLYRNIGLFRRLGVHRPLGLVAPQLDNIHWIDGAGRPLPRAAWRNGWRMNSTTYGYDIATINHYAVRSAESYLVKRDRGRVNHVDRDQSTAYWFRMNQNAEMDRSIDRYTNRVKTERETLSALPGVREAHAKCVAWHSDKIQRLLDEREYSTLCDAITSDRMKRLSRMPGRFGSNVYLAGPEVIPDEILERDLSEPWTYTIPQTDRQD